MSAQKKKDIFCEFLVVKSMEVLEVCFIHLLLCGCCVKLSVRFGLIRLLRVTHHSFHRIEALLVLTFLSELLGGEDSLITCIVNDKKRVKSRQ